MAISYDDGEGVKQDKQKAVELYRKACEGESMDSCYNLADSYEEGEGVEKDIDKAIELFTRVCVSGDSEGCQRVRSLQ